MDTVAVRTFVAAAQARRFQDAADELAVTQQAVSKRIASLEKALGVRLLTRGGRGAGLTPDGEAFLPHARELLRAEARALDAVRQDRRALRVDVIGRRLGPAALLGDFHRARPDAELDVVTYADADTAVEAVRSGALDVSFRAVTVPGRPLPGDIETAPVHDEPVQLLTGPGHALAGAGTLTPARLAGHRVWMPGLVPGSESAVYYADLAAAFGFDVEITGPGFGTEPLLVTLARTPSLATLVGARCHLVWPGEHDLRRIDLCDPVPVYPHSLVWRRDNPHPTLTALRAHLSAEYAASSGAGAGPTWAPAWARRPARTAR